MQWIQRGNNTTLSIRKSPQFVEFIFSRFIRLHYHLWSAMFMFFYWCWRQSWSQCWHYASVNTHRKVRCWPSLGLMRSADFFLHVFLCIQPPLFLTSFAVPAAQKSLQSKVWSSPDKRMFFLVISEFFNQLRSQKRLIHVHCTIKSWLMSAAEMVVLQAGSSAYAHNLCLINQ